MGSDYTTEPSVSQITLNALNTAADIEYQMTRSASQLLQEGNQSLMTAKQALHGALRQLRENGLNVTATLLKTSFEGKESVKLASKISTTVFATIMRRFFKKGIVSRRN